MPKAPLEEAERVVLRDGDLTRFGVVQAITYVAHETNKDPDVRFAMERLAGDYLAATPATQLQGLGGGEQLPAQLLQQVQGGKLRFPILGERRRVLGNGVHGATGSSPESSRASRPRL